MGPLKGIRVVEMVGIGPGPYAAMLLSDMGAEVIRIDRATAGPANAWDVLTRGRKSLAVNLKSVEGKEAVLKLLETADILIEGYRPGVMEKLGLGPDVCLGRNPKLVYGRMTGWGQYGPLAQSAGHDINYIAITGALASIGRAGEAPVPPLNLVGDFGGGTLFLVVGILAALWESAQSGQGQVVDAAISDGTISLMSAVHSLVSIGLWNDERGTNLLDGGAPFYDCYQCADGEWVAIGAVEPHFFAQLLERIGLAAVETAGGDALQGFDAQFDRARWPALRESLRKTFASQPRQYWCEQLEGSDGCFAPVLSIKDAPSHAHNQARQAFIERHGVVQSAPAPRFSRTASEVQGDPVAVGAHTEQLLIELGYKPAEIERMKSAGTVLQGDA
ncbi:MAG TPA: CaiB/BaiF CoA-transferase family protein [Pseudomonadales bacterium]